MKYDLSNFTNTQLGRMYSRIWERLRRIDGYQPFGYDWDTLWIVHPGIANAMYAVQTEANLRGIEV